MTKVIMPLMSREFNKREFFYSTKNNNCNLFSWLHAPWVSWKIDQFVMFQAMLPIRSSVKRTDVWKLSSFTHSGFALNLGNRIWKGKSKKKLIWNSQRKNVFRSHTKTCSVSGMASHAGGNDQRHPRVDRLHRKLSWILYPNC